MVLDHAAAEHADARPGHALGEQPLHGRVGLGLGGVGGALGLHVGPFGWWVERRRSASPAAGNSRTESRPAPTSAAASPAADQVELAADRGRRDEERQRRRLQQSRDQRLAPAEQPQVEQRRDAAHDEQREQEERHHRHRRGAARERVEVEAHPARDEEDRDEDAEADGLELAPEVRVGHLPVGVREREDRAGGERAEDDLESELLGGGGEADEQHERAPDADLGGGVLQSQRGRRGCAASAGRPARPRGPRPRGRTAPRSGPGSRPGRPRRRRTTRAG